jgi:amidase
MCGLLGLKPSRGRSSFGPGRGERWSGMSVEFMLTRSVRDCAALLDLLSFAMPGDPYAAPPPSRPFAQALRDDPRKLRIGVLTHAPPGIEVHAECSTAVEGTAKTLEQLGHRVERAHPAALDERDVALTWVQLVAVNVARSVEQYTELAGRAVTAADLEPVTLKLAEIGRSFSATQQLAAIDRMHAFGRRLCGFFEDHDLLLSPTQAAPPPRIGHLTSTAEDPLRAMVRSAPFGTYTLPFNMSGQPAISVPAGLSADGLPLGVQLAAAYGREDVLLQVAAQLERVRPWPLLAKARAPRT